MSSQSSRPGHLHPLASLYDEETARPSEWLRQLDEDHDRYYELLAETETLGEAAYRIARARCRTGIAPSDIPTKLELVAAASEISKVVNGVDVRDAVLLEECEDAGLLVITPMVA